MWFFYAQKTLSHAVGEYSYYIWEMVLLLTVFLTLKWVLPKKYEYLYTACVVLACWRLLWIVGALVFKYDSRDNPAESVILFSAISLFFMVMAIQKKWR